MPADLSILACTLCGRPASPRTKNHGCKPGPQYQCTGATTHVKYPDSDRFVDLMEEARKEQLKKRPKKI